MAAASPTSPPVSAVERWRRSVQGWAVPQEIRDASPEPEATLEPERFRWKAEEDAAQPVRPSRRRALEALPEGGSVLDVGVGGGASSFGLLPRAGRITGVDQLEGMLEAFLAGAADLHVEAAAVHGSWPETAGEVDAADVVVCHHAMYFVEDVEDFVAALTAKARHRVVLELSVHAPLASLIPLWKEFHGLDRPDRLVADEAEAVLRELGLAVQREDLELPAKAVEVTPGQVSFVRRRLFVGPERDPDIEAFLQARTPEPHPVAALWWPGAA